MSARYCHVPTQTGFRSEAAVVILLAALATVMPLVSSRGILLTGGIAAVALTTIAIRQRMLAASSMGVLFVTVFVLGSAGLGLQQAVFTLALAVYWVVMSRVPWLRSGDRWRASGSVALPVVALGVAFGLVSGLVVWLWYAGRQAELADLVEMVPDWPIWILLPSGVAFAVVNAVLEEAVYRGVVQDALERVVGSGSTSLGLQAAAFATLHFQTGFPRGVAGIGLAFLYGLVLGVLRRRSRGLAVPVVTHLVTDLVIVGILLAQVVG